LSKAKAARPARQIGGVRVPKQLGPSADRLVAFLRHPLVTDAIAAALVAGAGALAQGKGRREIAKAAGLGAGVAAVKASKGTERLGVAVLIAMAEVAVAALAKGAEKPKRG
jgi:hypothetical protein